MGPNKNISLKLTLGPMEKSMCKVLLLLNKNLNLNLNLSPNLRIGGGAFIRRGRLKEGEFI